MRTPSLVVLLVLLLVPKAFAQSVTLAWDREAATNNIASYHVYWGVASRVYTNSISAGTNITATVTNLVRGVNYYFAATATATNGLESDYSLEVSYRPPLPPPPPITFRIIGGD